MFVDFITHFPAFIISVATCVTCMGCLTCVYYVYTSIRDYYLWATGWNYSYTNEPASSQHTGPMYYFARLVEYENEIRTDHNGYIANPNSPRHPPGYSVPFQGPITPDLPQPAMLQGKFSEERIDNSNVSYFQNLLPTQTDEYHPLNQNTYSVNNFRLPTRTYIDEQTMTQTYLEAPISSFWDTFTSGIGSYAAMNLVPAVPSGLLRGRLPDTAALLNSYVDTPSFSSTSEKVTPPAPPPPKDTTPNRRIGPPRPSKRRFGSPKIPVLHNQVDYDPYSSSESYGQNETSFYQSTRNQVFPEHNDRDPTMVPLRRDSFNSNLKKVNIMNNIMNNKTYKGADLEQSENMKALANDKMSRLSKQKGIPANPAKKEKAAPPIKPKQNKIAKKRNDFSDGIDTNTTSGLLHRGVKPVELVDSDIVTRKGVKHKAPINQRDNERETTSTSKTNQADFSYGQPKGIKFVENARFNKQTGENLNSTFNSRKAKTDDNQIDSKTDINESNITDHTNSHQKDTPETSIKSKSESVNPKVTQRVKHAKTKMKSVREQTPDQASRPATKDFSPPHYPSPPHQPPRHPPQDPPPRNPPPHNPPSGHPQPPLKDSTKLGSAADSSIDRYRDQLHSAKNDSSIVSKSTDESSLVADDHQTPVKKGNLRGIQGKDRSRTKGNTPDQKSHHTQSTKYNRMQMKHNKAKDNIDRKNKEPDMDGLHISGKAIHVSSKPNKVSRQKESTKS